MTTAAEPDWRAFFAHPDYPRFVSGILTERRTAVEVEGIQELLDQPPGARILDLGCGQGRLAVPLAALGYRVTGLDGSERLLDLAAAAARTAGVTIEWLHGEMKDLDVVARFDAVLNIGTAIGYASQPDDDAALAAAARALVPGGQILVDTENRDHLLTTTGRTWYDMAGTIMWCERDHDPFTGRWHERVRWRDADVEHSQSFGLRLYTLAELAHTLRRAGFTVTRDDAWGNLGSAPYSVRSPRLVVRGRTAR